MKINTKIHNGALVIEIFGKFNSQCNMDFYKVIQEIEPTMKSIVVNLQNAEYMDSASLGLLLVLRDLTLKNKQDIQITGAKGIVHKMLDIANFGKIFTIK